MSRKQPESKRGPAVENLAGPLLAWYDRHRRQLPWRAAPGHRPDPYHVWLSEIMLQQTTVATVGPYFRRFLARWACLADLAAAPEDDVLAAWAGLGYYARARNLIKCANIVVRQHGGRFPDTEAGLLALPGIGPYTAAAIAAIAFDRQATILDGNVERVMARLHQVGIPLPKAKAELRVLAARYTPAARPGDYAQAIMDLGATICVPARPACTRCPVRSTCAAFAAGDMEAYPARERRAARPQRYGHCFLMLDRSGRIALEKRPERGLLGAMLQVPTTEWAGRAVPDAEALSHAPLEADWRRLPGGITHVFTHFALYLAVFAATGVKADQRYRWVEIDRLGDVALPSVMRKVVEKALAHAGAA